MSLSKRSVDPAWLTHERVHRPESVDRLWAVRRPGSLPEDGRLLIIAVDHPARGALAVRGESAAMASRTELLERVTTALARPGVDGVLATADILEDLLLLGCLDDAFVIGSMNRGGLVGASFELDDRFTAYDVTSLSRRGFQGGKMLTRINLQDPGSVATLEASGRAVTELADARMMALVEPFLCRREAGGHLVNQLDPASVISSAVIAAGLGATSAWTWLKLPVVEDMDRVLDATTLPVLLLGGDRVTDAEQAYAAWSAALTHPSAAGLVAGRALLYPVDGDIAAAVDTAAHLVHQGVS